MIVTSADLYQLGLFNPRFWGYFYKDSVNLCPDIKKISPVSGFLPFGRFWNFHNEYKQI